MLSQSTASLLFSTGQSDPKKKKNTDVDLIQTTRGINWAHTEKEIGRLFPGAYPSTRPRPAASSSRTRRASGCGFGCAAVVSPTNPSSSSRRSKKPDNKQASKASAGGLEGILHRWCPYRILPTCRGLWWLARGFAALLRCRVQWIGSDSFTGLIADLSQKCWQETTHPGFCVRGSWLSEQFYITFSIVFSIVYLKSHSK